jgi:hypothetical protein
VEKFHLKILGRVEVKEYECLHVLHSNTKCSQSFLGSSPAQASVAPIAHEKEESRLYCGKDKKSVSLPDTRLKEPVVRLNRLSAEVNF